MQIFSAVSPQNFKMILSARIIALIMHSAVVVYFVCEEGCVM